MKMRHGFVSNSSSSSFVVSFPKKPKTANEVLSVMFNSKQNGIIKPYDHIEGMLHIEIAEQVFSDIRNKRVKRATLTRLTEIFSTRYYYYIDNLCQWDGRKNDQYGGAWASPVGRYYGSDAKLLEKLRTLSVEMAVKDNQIQKEIWAELSKYPIKPPLYASASGTDPKTKKPYTKKQIKTYNEYSKAKDKWIDNNKVYQALRRKQANMDRMATYKEERKLSKQIAKIDAQNFLDDNKDKFIFIVEYSDNDGDKCTVMEHGEVFRNVPYVRISHH
jgi:hypothetical protein